MHSSVILILANEYYIDYPDYSPKEDFNTWLAGYEARVKSTFGFSVDEVDLDKGVAKREDYWEKQPFFWNNLLHIWVR